MYPILWELTEKQARVVLAVLGLLLLLPLVRRWRRDRKLDLRLGDGAAAALVVLAVGPARWLTKLGLEFPVEFPAYFTLLTIGFALAIVVARRWAGRQGLDREVATDLGLYMLIAGVIGSRIMHVLVDGYFWDYVHLCTDPSQVEWRITRARCLTETVGGVWDPGAGVCRPGAPDCFAWAKFWNGGLVYYGGFLFSAAVGMWFVRRHRFPFWKTVDMTGYAIVLGLVWGRLGCFLGGCCFGSQTDVPWAIRYGPWSPASEWQHEHGLLSRASEASAPIHPAQLYEAFGCIAIFFWLLAWTEPRKRFDGQVFLSFVALYATLRFVVEFFRSDMRGDIFGLSTSQLVGVGLLGVSAWGWRKLSDVRLPAAS